MPFLRASGLLDSLAELVAPTRCAGCELPGDLVCDECMRTLPIIDPAGRCLRCGAPSADGSAGECPECAGRDYAFSASRAFGRLAHPLSRLVSVHKDGGEERLAGPFASMLAATADEWLTWTDLLVPLPASPQGMRRRARDHMRDVARELSSITGLAAEALLERTGGRDQRVLGRDDRELNLARSLRLRAVGDSGDVPVPRRVLLLDDVFTTGATAHAAARLLLELGAEEVRFVAVARASSG